LTMAAVPILHMFGIGVGVSDRFVAYIGYPDLYYERRQPLQSRQIILAQERIYTDSSHSLLIWWSAATSHRGVL